jgi:hypothetical protein
MLDESDKHQIINAAIEILSNHPEGMKKQELRLRTKARLPQFEKKVGCTLLEYSRSQNAEIYSSSHLSYRLTKFEDSDSTQVPLQPIGEKVAESAFYKPFADWLVEDVEECTKAIPVGGAVFRVKFGTPDVIGVRKPSVGDIIPAPVEVVSAEIKVTGDGLITAFGQACSYKLFSHKSYIAVPRTAPDGDKDRLESLCLIFGIGLVLFDPASPDNPAFEIRTRAVKDEPDMFYVNDNIRQFSKAQLKELLG